MKNPIYLTDSELASWHLKEFGHSIPSDTNSPREHCQDLYIACSATIVIEDN